MEAKYTKGTWLMDCRDQAAVSSPNHLPIISEEGVQICLINHASGEINAHEYSANAKLIAAAPDMFNILEKLIRANKNLAKYNPDTFILPELWREAESILKKATE